MDAESREIAESIGDGEESAEDAEVSMVAGNCVDTKLRLLRLLR